MLGIGQAEAGGGAGPGWTSLDWARLALTRLDWAGQRRLKVAGRDRDHDSMEDEDEDDGHGSGWIPSPPVQGATVLHRLARWYGIGVQGATQGATKCYIGCYIFRKRPKAEEARNGASPWSAVGVPTDALRNEQKDRTDKERQPDKKESQG